MLGDIILQTVMGNLSLFIGHCHRPTTYVLPAFFPISLAGACFFVKMKNDLLALICLQ